MFKKGRRFIGCNKCERIDDETIDRCIANLPKYDVYIWWSEEDDCYLATVSEITGCVSHGDTPKEAAKELEIALGLHAATIDECDGLEIPAPHRTSFMEKLIYHHLDDSSVPLEG